MSLGLVTFAGTIETIQDEHGQVCNQNLTAARMCKSTTGNYAKRGCCMKNSVLVVVFGLLLNYLNGSAIYAQNTVAFDAPAIVVAERVNPEVVSVPLTGGDLYRLKIAVSTYIAPEFRGAISEYSFELHSPMQSMRVLDFSPKNETYTQFEGTVKVDSHQKKDEQFNFNLAAGYPGVGNLAASGDYQNHLNVQESYTKKPPMQLLTSSGTIYQGYGVFFKFRPGPVDVLEGSKEIAILIEVPKGWRADLLQVSMTAVGSIGSSRQQLLSQSRLWITTHREGDGAAAAQAQAYVRHERHLRGVAASKQREVNDRSLPTFWHKAGAALQIVDARIPKDYLTRVIFGRANPRFDDGSGRLPVDLRVAILDYWDQRGNLLSLSRINAQSPLQTVAYSN
jgi:hypothetical protein